MNLVLLPATEPEDSSFGVMPNTLDSYPEVQILHVQYPRMVWYNEKIREEAIRQIRAWNRSNITLVGFSKSALGAWNIALSIPDLISGTLLFDTPATWEELPPWDVSDYYPDVDLWRQDIPLRNMIPFRNAMAESHQLVMISGKLFHTEMVDFHAALEKEQVAHTFLPHPEIPHKWNAGWLEIGLEVLGK